MPKYVVGVYHDKTNKTQLHAVTKRSRGQKTIDSMMGKYPNTFEVEAKTKTDAEKAAVNQYINILERDKANMAGAVGGQNV